MESESIKIVKLEVKELIETLNKAFADEWLAYYQYWIGAEIVAGSNREAVIKELKEHALDELGHAQKVSKRIIQLGGTPLLNPSQWFDYTNCGYIQPDNRLTFSILKDNIKGEQCAIHVYNKILEQTRDKDPITYNMALSILEDEVEHENDLIALLDDLHFINK